MNRLNEGKLPTICTQDLQVTANMVWRSFLPSGDLAPGEKHGSETSMFDAAGCEIQSIELVLVRDGCATLKNGRNMQHIKFECHISHISSCYYFNFKSYSFILISIRIYNII